MTVKHEGYKVGIGKSKTRKLIDGRTVILHSGTYVDGDVDTVTLIGRYDAVWLFSGAPEIWGSDVLVANNITSIAPFGNPKPKERRGKKQTT